MVVLELITTEVEFADELHPLTIVVTEYKPASAACAFGITGFWSVLVNPLGPDQE